MADRITGAINFSNNFEVQYQGPLDARLSTPEFPQLTDSSIPFPYLGMLVAVTSDENRSGGSADNNGVYMLTSANSTLEASWTKVGSDPSAGGNPITAVAYTKADGNLKVTLTHDGTGSGTPIEYDVTIDTYESALTDTSTNVPTAVGGIGTNNTVADLNGLTQNQMWDKLLFPTINPTGGGNSAGLSDDSANLVYIGITQNVELDPSANRGTLSNPSGNWAGDVTEVWLTKPDGSQVDLSSGITAPTGIAPYVDNGHLVVQGSNGNTWSVTVTFDQGPMPEDSTGADFPSARFNGGTKTANTKFEGVWPIYYGDASDGWVELGKFSQNQANIPMYFSFPEDPVNNIHHKIAVPTDMITGGSVNWEIDGGTLGWATVPATVTTTTFVVHAASGDVDYTVLTKDSWGDPNNYRVNW